MRSGRHRAAGTGSALRTRPSASRFRLPRGSPPPPGLPAAHCQQPRFHCGTWPVTAAAGSRPGALCQGGQVTRTFRAYAGAHAGDAPGQWGPRGWGAALAAGRWGHKRLSRQAMTAAGRGGEGGRSHPPCPWCRFRNVSGYRSGSTKPCARAACSLVGDRRGAFQRRRRGRGRGRWGHRQRAAPAGGSSSAEAWAFSRGGQEGPGVRRRDRPGRPCCAAGPSWAWGADTWRRLSPTVDSGADHTCSTVPGGTCDSLVTTEPSACPSRGRKPRP